jgi:hypothetical protein
MATKWDIWGFTSGQSVSTSAASSAVAISSASCLAFGSGGRATFQGNITLNTWGNAMHFAQTTAEASVDRCTNSHLWPVYPLSNFTPAGSWVSAGGCMLTSAKYIATMTQASPHPARGILFRFLHDSFAVQCSGVNVWAGTANCEATHPQNCIVAVVELGTPTQASKSPTWDTVDPTHKLALTSHTTDQLYHY